MDQVYWSLSLIFALLGVLYLYKKKWWEMTIAVIIGLTIFGISNQIAQYPNFVRDLYFEHPSVMALAVTQQIFADPAITKKQAIKAARNEGFGEVRLAKVIYLCASDPKDTGINNTRGLYLNYISKVPISTNKELFWYLKGWEEEMLLEQKTGKIIYYKQEDQVLIPVRPDTRKYVMPKTKKLPFIYTQEGIKSIFMNNDSKTFKEFAKIVRVKNLEDYQEQLNYYRETIIQALLKYDKELYGELPTKEDEGRYRVLLARIEQNFKNVWGDSAEEQLVIPTYIEKASYQNRPCWIVVCNWTPASDLKNPGAKETGVSLARRAVLVISSTDYSLLYSLKN